MEDNEIKPFSGEIVNAGTILQMRPPGIGPAMEVTDTRVPTGLHRPIKREAVVGTMEIHRADDESYLKIEQ